MELTRGLIGPRLKTEGTYRISLVRLSVRPFVRSFVRPSVRPSGTFFLGNRYSY